MPTGTLVERWDGTQWTILPTPNPAGAQGAELDGVACASAADCIAFGATDNPHGQLVLSELWDGTQWTILQPPNPPGAQRRILSGVACTSPAACTATGLAFTITTPLVYAVRWNSTQWTIQPTPTLPSAYDINNPAVGCPSATTCVAVGAFFNTFPNGPKHPLAERWTG